MSEYHPKDDSDALFDSRFLRWYHLNGSPALVEITDVERGVEMTLPGGKSAKKPVLSLRQIDGQIEEIKPLVLNVTNRDAIKEFLGRRPSQWIGERIVLMQAETKLRGKETPCIRIRQPKAHARKPRQTHGTDVREHPEEHELDDANEQIF